MVVISGVGSSLYARGLISFRLSFWVVLSTLYDGSRPHKSLQTWLYHW